MAHRGLDNFAGTSGNDTIIGSISTTGTDLDTLSTLDIVNGGAGIDTLKIASSLPAIVLPNMTNDEVVEVEGTAGVTVDTSAVAGVTDLNVLKHGSAAVGATAAATTNVAVTLKEAGAAGAPLTHAVNGGNNVTVTAADAGAATADVDTITIGGTTAAKGDVVVNVTGKAYDAAAAQIDLGAVTVTGGKTVSVTQKASSDTSKAAADTTANKVVQGAVTVNANTETTTVTVKQDATVAAKNAANTTGGVTETATIKFGALKGGDALAINGLTFTAKAGVDLTAAEVAAAFSNMVSGLANPNTDTQGSQVTAKGVFTGAFNTGAVLQAGTPAKGTGYTAAAASGDTVVFTAARANQDATDLTATLTNTSGNSVAPTVTVVQGQAHNATPAGGVMGVDAGKVTITGTNAGADATAVKTITVDGYSATLSASTGNTTALETLNLSNGGDFALTQAAATLALNLTNVGTAAKSETLTSASALEARAAINLDAASAIKTLNVKSEGTNTVSLDLAAGTTALNVSGTGLLDAKTGSDLGGVTTIKVTETAGLNLVTNATTAIATTNVTSVDTTGTTGAVTIAIDGTKATYTGGAGVDKVTITNANTAIAKAIDLGAGDDTLTLNVVGATTVAVPTVDLKGGDGVDTIALSAADAVALSANGTFAGKIDGFEKLSIGNAAAAGTVNLANLDNINYVVSANSDSVVEVATKEVITVDFSVPNSGAVTGADTIEFAGTTLTLNGGETAAQIATAFYGKTFTGWDVTSVGGTVVTLTRTTGGDLADIGTGDFTITDAGGGDLPAVTVKTTTQGAAAPATAAALTIDKMASGGTLELTAVGAGAIVNVTDAIKGTKGLNVVVNAANTVVGGVTTTLGTVKAAEVETINVSVANKTTTFSTVYGDVKVADPASVSTLALDANAAKAVTVTGAGNLTLSLSDSSTLVGGVTTWSSLAAKVATVDASAATGALTLDLTNHNGVAVTVTGGAGNDVLSASVGTNAKADVLVGGAGNDTLNAGSNGAKLTGGAGNDLFVLTAGTKESNTYSSILDFQAGDVLELIDIGDHNVSIFAKLSAVLNENTATFANYVDDAIAQAGVGEAVWFNYKGNAYVAVDNTNQSTVFENGVDAIIELVGIDLANASFNSNHGTVALI
ncbi:hypothetical protein IEG05_00320 [Pseudomonas kunmingensis]|uniref:beta strand repeat-containing protein n=1 Tax=Stutzerimonas kunmingensis TaxID=1211807 RepID=UPI001746C049|nr:hypothetical protein [Stutzerimonas kunmingensis]MBD3873682.1 hypothetical protein [Stutzerimonas kunmingensis]